MSIDTKYSVERSAAVSSQSGSSFMANQDVGSIKPNLVTPYSPNWPGHLTEHKPRNKRCKNETCKCKTKSNRAFECWQCGTEFPTTKAAKRKYFSKNNPAPEGAIKKRRKKNADKRVNASCSPPVNSAIKRRVVRKKPSMTKNDQITALMKEVTRLKKKQRADNMRRKLV